MLKNFFFRALISAGSILLGWFPPLWAQTSGSDSLRVWLDYAGFKFNPQAGTTVAAGPPTAYVEIYYALDRSQLAVATTDTEKIAILDLSMKIEDLNQKEVASQSWKVGCRVAPEDTGKSSYIFYDLQALQLLAGEYSLDFVVTQAQSHKVGKQKINLLVPDFSENQLKLSDIQLALSADPDTSDSKFTKAGRMILPNATKIYGATSPLLYFYAEAYHFSLGTADNTYQVSYSILDSLGKLYKEYPATSHKKPGSSSVILSGLNISTLPKGKYYLQISLEDLQIKNKVEGKKEFWVMKETLPSFQRSGERLLPQTESEAKQIRDEISYIATQDELRMYDQLNLTGKQKFIKEFWNKKDPDLSTLINEYKVQHYQRIFEANQLFASQADDRKSGWRTDQGRVYVVYGKPDFIEPHHYSLQLKPWEKWLYNNLQGGVYFVFSDEQGLGFFRLVHSTARGEKNDPNWEKVMQQIIEE